MARLGPIDLQLKGTHVTLEPLSHHHAEGLKRASAAGALHRLWYTSVPSATEMAAEIDRRLAERDAGRMLPFTLLDAGGAAVGMTTYMNIDHALPRVEIGSTWITPRAQRGPLNTEAKLLLLTQAFETWDCVAVEFRTHRLNLQSRRAIERLGAQLDGILRAHTRMADGTLRDTACYSIVAAEWPAVRSHLRWRLAQPRRE
ncbi:MAG: GNAT family protein [Pseudomonadota bacterium]